jgi:hypothetical protein
MTRGIDLAIRGLIYTFHLLGFLICFYSDTEFHRQVFVAATLQVLMFPILCILATGSYYLATTGPGFVTDDEASLLTGDSNVVCPTCNVIPPIRASHCKHCGHCVLRRDHHCVWLGICVGMDNHVFFILFLFFETLLMFRFIREAWPVTQGGQDIPFIQWLATSFCCSVIVAASAFGLFQTLILLPMHIVLVLLNRTTWELIKGGSVEYLKNWRSGFSPFSRGIIGNVKEFLTMRRLHPKYEIPIGDALEQWRRENSFLVNDSYECC